MEYISFLFLLLVGHALADYPLQGAFIARFKNRNTDNPFPDEGHPWVTLLLAHCFIHAGFVFMITGVLWLALIELVLHFVIDVLKNECKISFRTDQILHVVCKVVYVLIIFIILK